METTKPVNFHHYSIYSSFHASSSLHSNSLVFPFKEFCHTDIQRLTVYPDCTYHKLVIPQHHTQFVVIDFYFFLNSTISLSCQERRIQWRMNHHSLKGHSLMWASQQGVFLTIGLLPEHESPLCEHKVHFPWWIFLFLNILKKQVALQLPVNTEFFELIENVSSPMTTEVPWL